MRRPGNQYEITAIARGAAASAGNRLWAPLLSLAATPYLLGKLGAQSYGLFALTLSAVAWLSLADFGLGPALRVRLARGDEKPAEQARLFAAAVRAQALVALATLAAGAGLTHVLPAWLEVGAALTAPATKLIGWLTLGTAVAILASPFSAALEARGFVALEQTARTVRAVGRTALAVAFVAAGGGVEALGLAHLLASLAAAVWSFALCRRYAPDLRSGAPSARLAELGPTLAGGVWLTAGSLAGVLIAGVDRIVVAKFLSLEATAAFALTAASFLLLEGLLTRAVDAARPFLAARLGAGRSDEARRLHGPLTMLCLLAGVVAAAAAFAANGSFVAVWAGPENYAGPAVDAFFASNLALHLWILPQRAALTAGWRLRRQVGVRLAEGALNLGLSVALVRPWGLAGVAAGTTLAALATSAWLLPRLAAGVLGGERPFAACLPALALAAALAPVAWGARLFALAVGGWAGPLVAAAAVGGAVTALFLLVWPWPVSRALVTEALQ